MARPDFLEEGFGTVARLGWEEVWVPEAVSYKPQTMGWGVLAAMVLAALIWVAWRAVRAYKANGYRRRALADLALLKARISEDLMCATALPVLLKRTALGGFARREVASLTGNSWVAFLNSTCEDGFDASAAELLIRLSYRGSGGVARTDIGALINAVERWVRRHRAAV